MSKTQRQLKKKFVLFCEGDTEYNYFDAIRKIPNTEISIHTINMHGGGYKNFLSEIKKNGKLNRQATFIIVDGDRAQNIPEEKDALKELIEYCKLQNTKKNFPPFFLIVNCPDFEYIACLHDENYKGGDTEKHITKIFGFKSLEEFKRRTDIYNFLHKNSRYHEIMLKKIGNQKFIKNEYRKNLVIISVYQTIVEWELLSNKNSNINEFFEILS
ncbi:MAG: RloB domain-containing protein [Selenomonadaceae bacterium]|nr:RloB domain-containing protein [Selenomonadaceae bacterium]